MASLVIKVVDAAFGIIQLAIVIECIASWIPELRYNSFMEIVYKITTPILEPFRRLQNRYIRDLTLDISPILAFLALGFIKDIVNRAIWMILR